jgi:4-hydroxybenzoate polyprenyltransferase
MTITDVAMTLMTTLPDPTPEQPPGTEGITTLLNWLSWIVIIMGMAGFLISAGYLAFASFTGREINGFKGLVLAIIVCILATSAGAIMRVFI